MPIYKSRSWIFIKENKYLIIQLQILKFSKSKLQFSEFFSKWKGWILLQVNGDINKHFIWHNGNMQVTKNCLYVTTAQLSNKVWNFFKGQDWLFVFLRSYIFCWVDWTNEIKSSRTKYLTVQHLYCQRYFSSKEKTHLKYT